MIACDDGARNNAKRPTSCGTVVVRRDDSLGFSPSFSGESVELCVPAYVDIDSSSRTLSPSQHCTFTTASGSSHAVPSPNCREALLCCSYSYGDSSSERSTIAGVPCLIRSRAFAASWLPPADATAPANGSCSASPCLVDCPFVVEPECLVFSSSDVSCRRRATAMAWLPHASIQLPP